MTTTSNTQTYTQLSLFDTELDKFRKGYRSTRVTQHPDCLVYNVPVNTSDFWAEDANKVIKVLKLDLVAIPSQTRPKDTFVVQLKEADV